MGKWVACSYLRILFFVLIRFYGYAFLFFLTNSQKFWQNLSKSWWKIRQKALINGAHGADPQMHFFLNVSGNLYSIEYSWKGTFSATNLVGNRSLFCFGLMERLILLLFLHEWFLLSPNFLAEIYVPDDSEKSEIYL